MQLFAIILLEGTMANCSFVWPSNNQPCKGRVVPCEDESLKPPGEDAAAWLKLGGRRIWETAQANPGRCICNTCGTIQPMQLNIFNT